MGTMFFGIAFIIVFGLTVFLLYKAFKKIKFNVKVVPNDHPMTHVFHSVPDIEVVEDQFFKVVLSLLAFSDKETVIFWLAAVTVAVVEP